MLLEEFKTRFAHGLLIIAAPESSDTHDDWDPSTQPVDGGPDSIYCSVVDAVTAIATVTCVEDSEVETDLEVLYQGALQLPSSRLTLYDPNETISMTLPASSQRVFVTIYGDDDEPEHLLIQLTSTDSEP